LRAPPDIVPMEVKAPVVASMLYIEMSLGLVFT